MNNEKKYVLAPSMFRRFQCKGVSCRYSCCQDWKITMTKEEYHEWKKCGILPKGKLESENVRLCPDGERTEKLYAQIVLDKDRKCPYLTNDGLCWIQKEYGVKKMTTTCRVFPRVTRSYFDHAECSFSLGCGKVLELLLEEKEGIFLEEEEPQQFEIYDSEHDIGTRRKYPKLKNYYDIQTLSLALLQSDEMTMENRLFILGMAIDKIESLYAENRENDVAVYTLEFLQAAQQKESWGILKRFPDERPLAVYNSVISAVATLSFTEKIREKICSNAAKGTAQKKECGSDDPELEYYQECRERFARWITGKEYFLENVMVMCLLWLNIPFRDLDKSLWENYLYLIWVWIILKGILSMSLTEESSDEEMIDLCTMLFRNLGHNVKQFTDIINEFQKTGASLAHVAILLRSC